MDIGEEEETVTVEPIEDPVPREDDVEPVEAPTLDPDLVPAAPVRGEPRRDNGRRHR